MPRPKKEFPPKRSRYIHFRVTDDMYDNIAIEAERAKLSVSEYLDFVLELFRFCIFFKLEAF